MMFGLRHPFTYYRCASCGSLWLADVPDDLGAYYGSSYYSMAADPKGAQPSVAASVWAKILLRLPPALVDRVAGRRGFPRYLRWFIGVDVSLESWIADVGSGEAGVLTQLSRHGFTHLWGFDPFIGADKDLGRAHYRRLTIGDASGQFDVIMFHHSLEHVPDPVGTLRSAADKLAQDGAIIVRIPVAGSFADRHYGADWVSLDPPRHLGVPSLPGMRHAAARAGLRVDRVFFDSEALQFWGSDLYRNNIPLSDEAGRPDPNRETQLKRWADALNRRGEGDSAGFLLRRAGNAAPSTAGLSDRAASSPHG